MLKVVAMDILTRDPDRLRVAGEKASAFLQILMSLREFSATKGVVSWSKVRNKHIVPRVRMHLEMT